MSMSMSCEDRIKKLEFTLRQATERVLETEARLISSGVNVYNTGQFMDIVSTALNEESNWAKIQMNRFKA